MIYTSYFARVRELSEHGVTLISVSRTCPETKFMPTVYLQGLAPSWDLLRDFKGGKCTEEEYTKRYLNEIRYTLKESGSLLKRYAKEGNDCALLCWEGKNKFCHRHILAQALHEEFGYEIEEWDPPKPKKEAVYKGQDMPWNQGYWARFCDND